MTTQGEFTGEILRSGADLLRNAEYAVAQAKAAVELVAGERALIGAMDEEQQIALHDFMGAYESLRESIVSSNGDLAEHLPDAQLPLEEQASEQDGQEGSKVPALEAGEELDVSGERAQPDNEPKETQVEAAKAEQDDEVPEGRHRQETVLVHLFGDERAAEIQDLPYEKIQHLGEVAAAFYGRMDLHARAESARDERVDMIKRYVADGEPSPSIAKDYGLTSGAPYTSVKKAVDIMVRDLEADVIQRAYESVVNS
jgi:hypothetical protein